MALPHSPGRQSDLSSMAESDNSSRTRCLSHKSSGSSFLSKLVAGKHPFSKSARSRRDSVEVEVPPRTTSLATEESNPARISSTATDTTAGHAIASTNSSVSHLEQPSEPAANPNPNPDPDVTRHVALEPTPLERQRQELVDRVVEEARRNKKAPLDEVGRSRFEQAGFGHLIDKKSDVEVDTRWLKPVVHVSPSTCCLNAAHPRKPSSAKYTPSTKQSLIGRSTYITSSEFPHHKPAKLIAVQRFSRSTILIPSCFNLDIECSRLELVIGTKLSEMLKPSACWVKMPF